MKTLIFFTYFFLPICDLTEKYTYAYWNGTVFLNSFRINSVQERIDSICLYFTMAIHFPSEMVSRYPFMKEGPTKILRFTVLAPIEFSWCKIQHSLVYVYKGRMLHMYKKPWDFYSWKSELQYCYQLQWYKSIANRYFLMKKE